MALVTANGVTAKLSNHSVDQTVDRLKSILQARGVTLFALVDHSGEAEKAGMPMIAIDLPLKILVWEDDQARVWLSYNDPAYLQQRHHVPEQLLQNIAVAEALADQAAQ